MRALRSQFDATGRVLAVTQADESVYGTATTLRTDYLPLRTVAYDGEDLDPSSAHVNKPTTTVADGLGRTLRLERLLAPEAPPVVIGFRYDALGGIVTHQRHRDDGRLRPRPPRRPFNNPP